jgi:hypothetical protein
MKLYLCAPRRLHDAVLNLAQWQLYVHVSEQDDEKNIRTQERGSNRRLDKITL